MVTLMKNLLVLIMFFAMISAATAKDIYGYQQGYYPNPYGNFYGYQYQQRNFYAPKYNRQPQFNQNAPQPLQLELNDFDVTTEMDADEVMVLIDKKLDAMEEAMEAKLKAAEKMFELKEQDRMFESEMDKKQLEKMKKDYESTMKNIQQKREQMAEKFKKQ